MIARKQLLALSLVVLVALAGCAGTGGNDSDASNGTPNAGNGGSANTQSADSATTGGQERNALAVQQRALIRTGNLTLEVENFEEANANVTRLAREQGGFVSDSSERVHRNGNRTWTTGKIVFRVPAENFSMFFEQAKRIGEVEKSNTGAKDVTDQLVDVEARLTNLRSQREQLRGLYKNASDTEAVLSVQKRLSDVQGEIERLEAKQQSLEDRVAYSTVTVRMQEPRPDAETKTPEQQSWHETGVVAAFLDSVDGAFVMLRAIVVGTAYLLPYLVVLGAPVAGIFVWRRNGNAQTPANQSEPVETKSAGETVEDDESDESNE
ncbi:protein of unknown function [Haladaptatus litoreus]|uniref:DUF4349 domain-containing protein n=1 Tax=Haladaptatus litoreus TaxID=553468 RepID=A0A1N6X7Y2_9EURY|nr:DUF4349 domain-containing protein [Haladaptatus litoreus]SIQ98462.1 protein of unknown function [Haladaptatus litoreus]